MPILELRCGVAEQTKWFAESVIQKCCRVSDIDLIFELKDQCVKFGSIFESIRQTN